MPGAGQPIRLGALAERLGGRAVEGDPDFLVCGVASLEEGGPDEIGFVRGRRWAGGLAGSRIGAVIAPPGLDVGSRPVIRSASPNLDLARAARIVHPEPAPRPGVHPSAVVEPDAEIEAGAAVGALCFVGAGSRIGAGSVLHPRVAIYEDVVIGRDCVLHSGVVVREGTRIGDRVLLQPGAVIGGDGFGYEFDERGALEKVPQLGIVVLEDDVEVGALAAVDRARFAETRLGRGTKLDNFVQIGHNVTIGAGSALAAQTGIAGGTVLGKRVFMMAQSGAGNRARLGDGVFAGVRAGVVQDVEPGTRVFGFPAVAERAWHRSVVALARLPELLRRVRALERRIGRDDA